MKKRLAIISALLIIISLGLALAFPRTHFALLGWLHGEAYYDGQPTSYWAAAIRKHPFAGESGDVCKKLEEGGPAAIPVLCQLLEHDNEYVRQQAKIALEMIDWGQEPVTPAMARTLVETAPDLLARAVQHLAADQRQALDQQLSRELKDARGPNRGRAALALALLRTEGQTELLTIAANDGPLVARLYAAILLWEARQNTDLVIRTLVDVLQNSDRRIRWLAGSILKQVGVSHKESVTRAMLELLAHRDAAIRWEAVSILEQIGPNDDAITALLQAVKDESVDVRRKAAAALASRQVQLPKSAIPTLLAALGDDATLRVSTMRILTRVGVGDKIVLDHFLSALEHDPNGQTRAEAAATLSLIGLHSSEVVVPLANALRRDGDSSVRANAAESLRRIARGAARGLPELIFALKEDRDPQVRTSAALAMGSIATDEEHFGSLLVALEKDPDRSVRVAAAEALGEAGVRSKTIVAALARSLNDKELEVRLAACKAIARVDTDNPVAVIFLKELLADQDEKIRERAVFLLGLFGPAAGPAVPDLIRLIDSSEEDICLYAIDSLGAIGPRANEALPAIKEQLRDSETSRRLAAAKALWRIHRDPEAIQAFIEALKDEADSCRKSAAQALAEVGVPGEAAIPRLSELLNDPSTEVQKTAREALDVVTGKLAPKTAQPGLEPGKAAGNVPRGNAVLLAQ
jgi:HEAT repeat protein